MYHDPRDLIQLNRARCPTIINTNLRLHQSNDGTDVCLQMNPKHQCSGDLN